MGTRSVIYFQERRNGRTVVYAVFWQHWDGSLKGVGARLANFLQQVVLVSWMEIGPEAEKKENKIVCHGFGDLVARFIRKTMKDEPSDTSLFPLDDEDVDGDDHGIDAEYTYRITNTEEGILVQVYGLDEEGEELTRCAMSIAEFVQLCGSGASLQSGPPPCTVQLEGSVLSWTPQWKAHESGEFRVTVRGGPGTLPIIKTVAVRTLDLETILKANTQYEVTVSQCLSMWLYSQSSSIVKYTRGDIVYQPTVTGTTSLIFFIHKTVHAVVYQQWDGELEGVGCMLAALLKDLCVDMVEEYVIRRFNFYNLVARYVRKIKMDKPGHPFYLCPSSPGCEADYNYYVLWDDSVRRITDQPIKKVRVKINDSHEMTVDEFLEMCATARSCTVASLRTQCTSVIMSALLQQRALKADQLHARLPHYVPTVVKKSLVEAVFGTTPFPSSSTAPSPSGDSPLPAKRAALSLAY